LPLVNSSTKVLFIANPNNPTGTIVKASALERLIQQLPRDMCIVIDEAYGEYVKDPEYPDVLALQKKHPNIIILRTFSKMYGLAGLRIGYAIANKQYSEALKQRRIPYYFNSLSEDAALAALADQEFVASCAHKNSHARQLLVSMLQTKGLNAIPSQANFVYVHFDNDIEKEFVFQHLLSAGFVTCNLSLFGQPHAIRIGVPDEATIARLVACF
jgi:histidinol-phosphate aminotransferase